MTSISDKKYIVAGREVVELTKKQDGFWYDRHGTAWGLIEKDLSSDEEVRAGIGWFSIKGYEREVRAHDYIYASSIYQAYNDREEADAVLFEHLKGSTWRRPFYYISRLLGGFFWENKKTR